MFSFSDDAFKPILEEKNLSIKDERFFDNLNKTRKSLIIGKNAAGKTRLLQTIEEFCRGKKEKDSDDFILLLLYCTKIDIDIPDSKNEGIKEIPNKEITKGIIQRNYPQNNILTTNRETLLYLLKTIPERPQDEYDTIMKSINDDMRELLDKDFQIRDDGTKKELLITRNTLQGKTPMPVLEEWNSLSPGERIIIFLFLILLYYLQQMKAIIGGKEIIILIDEPEVHLHPEVMLNLITKKLFKYFSEDSEEKINGHLFIASHSVFLIPHFNFEEHIYLNKNCIMKKNSNLYKNLYGDLIGLETEITQTGKNLFDFLGSVYSWEYASFISECFIKPVQVDNVTSKDTQFVALNEIIQGKIKKSGSITILDYGCGEVARIGQCLVEKYRENGKENILKKHIQYFVYDIPECKINENMVNKQNIPCLIEIIQNQNELITKKETFDIIFLFNVLHEMDILHWEEQINILLALLKSDGCLVFCERKVLAKGEEPYGSSGYLLYSAKELKKMFNFSNVQELAPSGRSSVNLNTTIIVNDQNLKDITNTSIIESLEELKKNTKEKIDSCLRKDEILSARNYAFYCQQYFNADCAITLLNSMLQNSSDNTFPQNLIDWSDAEILDIQSPQERESYFLERNKRRNLKRKMGDCFDVNI